MWFGKIEVVFGTKIIPKTANIRSFESTNFSNANPTRVASPEIHPQKARLQCIFNSPLRCFNVQRIVLFSFGLQQWFKCFNIPEIQGQAVCVCLIFKMSILSIYIIDIQIHF